MGSSGILKLRMGNQERRNPSCLRKVVAYTHPVEIIEVKRENTIELLPCLNFEKGEA